MFPRPEQHPTGRGESESWVNGLRTISATRGTEKVEIVPGRPVLASKLPRASTTGVEMVITEPAILVI